MLEVFLLAVAMIELDLLIVIVSLLDGFERKVVRYLIMFVCNVTLGRDRKTRNGYRISLSVGFLYFYGVVIVTHQKQARSKVTRTRSVIRAMRIRRPN